MRRSSFFLLPLLAALSSCLDRPGDADGSVADQPTAEQADEYAQAPGRETLIVVVRHAEKSNDDPNDPSLSEAGLQRAQALAAALTDSKVAAIYTSQFKRTKQTAEPLALATGLPIQERPITGANLATYANDLAQEIRVKHRGQTVLVVNHSNTVPEIVTALSGAAAAPISESEFSRFYAVTHSTQSGARVVVARY